MLFCRRARLWGMAASPGQRQRAADVLRGGGKPGEAALAAGVGLTTLKCWRKQPSFQALLAGSPDIRPGLPARIGGGMGAPVLLRDLRCRIWLSADGEVLGS